MTDSVDPWLKKQFALISSKPDGSALLAKCKFVVEDRRCNAKFSELDDLARHLRQMHDFRFSKPRRFMENYGDRKGRR